MPPNQSNLLAGRDGPALGNTPGPPPAGKGRTLDEKLIGQWYPVLFRTALRLTGSGPDAADVTQQAFCRALEHWGTFRHGSSVLTWMHQILVNCARDHVRRAAVRRTHPLEEWAPIVEDRTGPGVPEKVMNDEKKTVLRHAIMALAAPVRDAFVATVLDGYSYREASELLAVPVGTVASRVSAARRELFQAMRNRFPEA